MLCHSRIVVHKCQPRLEGGWSSELSIVSPLTHCDTAWLSMFPIGKDYALVLPSCGDTARFLGPDLLTMDGAGRS